MRMPPLRPAEGEAMSEEDRCGRCGHSRIHLVFGMPYRSHRYGRCSGKILVGKHRYDCHCPVYVPPKEKP